jgi:GrpB-like predicted nucleotidyltransferase (UPF0157 family)
MTAPVVIVDYDPQWPIRYQEEKGRILEAIGRVIVAIEHIGSTAVPGLGAKPIIDIMVAVSHLADAEECIEPLQGMGYEYAPKLEVSMPQRRYFDKGPPGGRTHHLHMVELASEFWQRHLLFRDFLRDHPQVAREYDQLKRELAARYGSDRVGYTEAKTPFIRSVEARARALTIPQRAPTGHLRPSSPEPRRGRGPRNAGTCSPRPELGEGPG